MKIRRTLLAALIVLISMSAYADSTMLKVGTGKNMNAQLLTPDGPGPYPALLILHTSGGLQNADVEFAKRMVKEGYVALVPSFLEAYGISARTRQQTFTSDAAPIYADFVACLEVLRQHAKVDGKKLGAIGFSNGGYFALWLAATGQVQAGVSYYGALTGAGTDRALGRFSHVFNSKSSPVLILHGTDDATVPFAKAVDLDAMLTAAQSRHEFYQYPGAQHNFERNGGGNNEAAAADAWQRTQSFLGRLLKE